jgi:hypothetical protein
MRKSKPILMIIFFEHDAHDTQEALHGLFLEEQYPASCTEK